MMKKYVVEAKSDGVLDNQEPLHWREGSKNASGGTRTHACEHTTT